MRYCEFCGTELEGLAQCTCKEAQAEAKKREAQRPPVISPVEQSQPEAPQAESPKAQPQPEALAAPKVDLSKTAPKAQAAPQPEPPAAAPQAPAAQPQPTAVEAPRRPIDVPAIDTEQIREQAAQAQEKAKDTAKELWAYLKAYFRAPAQAVREAGDTRRISVVLTVLRALLTGLALFGVLRKLCASAAGSILDAGVEGFTVSAPFLGSIFCGALIALIGMALFVLAFAALIKLQKGDLSLRGVWQTSANNGVLVTVLFAAAFLLSFVSIPAAMACMILAALAAVICGVLTAQILCPGAESGRFWLAYFTGAAIAAFLGYQIFPKLAMKAVGGITLGFMSQSFTVSTLLEQAGGDALSLSSILQNVVNQILGGFF